MPHFTFFYFTFSASHLHSGKYLRIAGTFESAREEMNRRYPEGLGYQYQDHSKVAHLTELTKKGI